MEDEDKLGNPISIERSLIDSRDKILIKTGDEVIFQVEYRFWEFLSPGDRDIIITKLRNFYG
jgi:hypothetical protein